MKYFEIMDGYYAEVCVQGYVLRKKNVSEDGYEHCDVVNTFPTLKSLIERVARYKTLGLIDKGRINTLGEFVDEEEGIIRNLTNNIVVFSKI